MNFEERMAPRIMPRQFHHVYCHDTHCGPAARPLTVSVVAKIEVVRVYSPRFEEHPIDNNGPDNEQHR